MQNQSVRKGFHTLYSISQKQKGFNCFIVSDDFPIEKLIHSVLSQGIRSYTEMYYRKYGRNINNREKFPIFDTFGQIIFTPIV